MNDQIGEEKDSFLERGKHINGNNKMLKIQKIYKQNSH